MDQLRSDLRKPGSRQQVLTAEPILLGYYPRGVMKHLSKKIKETCKRASGMGARSRLEQGAEE